MFQSNKNITYIHIIHVKGTVADTLSRKDSHWHFTAIPPIHIHYLWLHINLPWRFNTFQSEEVQDQEVLKKADEFWKEEKRARSGRRREHPEAVTIPSLKEDPLDNREYRVCNFITQSKRDCGV